MLFGAGVPQRLFLRRMGFRTADEIGKERMATWTKSRSPKTGAIAALRAVKRPVTSRQRSHLPRQCHVAEQSFVTFVPDPTSLSARFLERVLGGAGKGPACRGAPREG